MIRYKALWIILILISHIAYGFTAFASPSYFLHLQAKNQSSWHPIHWAVVYGVDWGEDSTVQMLLDKGADIEAKDSMGMTPLQLALANDKLEIAKLLIKNKADIEAKDNNGNTVLLYAAARRSKEAIKLLVDSGADLDVKDDSGDTALEILWKPEYSEEKILELSKPLIENGASLESRNWQDHTLLIRAVISGWYDAAKLLLDKDADINASDKTGKTVLNIIVLHYHSRQNNNTDGIEFLLKHGADTGLADKAGNTPLHQAAMKSNIKPASMLLESGADPTIANKDGKTALDNAKLMQNNAMVQLLTTAN